MARGVQILGLAATLVLAAAGQPAPAAEKGRKPKPIVIAEQGSFMVGGTVFTEAGTFDPTLSPVPPAGQTFHGDHAYVQYQIPPDARKLPLVMWHGGGQFSKTWESTPDGREGFQTIFLRRGFAVYILDQPRRGRAGRSTAPVTLTPAGNEPSLFFTFRLGIWPDYFPGVQFPRDPASLEQYWRQQTPSTGPTTNDLLASAVAALFEKIGPAVLLTHSASGGPGWLAAIKSEDVKAIVSYEPVQFFFPEGEVPPPIVTPKGATAGVPVSLDDFRKLTRVPIQIIYGDNIPTSPSPYTGLDLWYRATAMAARFVEAVNRHGGDARLLHLPEIGVYGNTHFPFSDLNNVEIADLLSDYLREKRLDRR